MKPTVSFTAAKKALQRRFLITFEGASEGMLSCHFILLIPVREIKITMKIVEKEIFAISDLEMHSLQIIDADWRANLGLIAILEEKERFKILFGNEKRVFAPLISITVEYPVIRWVDNEKILLCNPRNETGEDNVFLLDLEGRVISSFNAGDGIMDIRLAKEGIWISYFDEGIFGEGISTEGLVLFSLGGEPMFVYHTGIPERPFLTSCDAMCEDEGPAVWIFPIMMPDVDPALLQVDAKEGTVKSFPAPELLDDSTALSIRGNDAYFHSQFNPEGHLYYWALGSEKPQLAGQVEGILRGLKTSEDFLFISVSEKSVRLLNIIKD